MSLTPRQHEVLTFIRAFRAEHGFAPTHAEIAAGLGFRSANAAHQHVRALVRKGVLDLSPGRARSLRPLEGPGATLARDAAGAREAERLPLIGEVAAGSPVLAAENVEERLAVAPGLFRPRADYLLRVRGDSMIEAGIAPGDLVAVHRRAELAEGAIGVVRLDDEVTVKRWHRRGALVVLEPANARLAPIRVDPARTAVHVEGLVVGLIRRGLTAGQGGLR